MELEEQAVETVPTEDPFDRAFADAVASQEAAGKAEEVEDAGDDTGAAAATPDDMEKAAGSGEETAEDSLLSPDEYDSLKDDPVALRKALHKSYTQKTQALAAERKKLQDRDYVAELARAHGLLRDEKPAEPQGEPEDPFKDLREVLGDELADVLVPSIRKMAVKEAEKVVGPIIEAERRRQIERMESGVKETLEEFSKRHPGWEKHEREMVALGENLQKGPGMNNLDYMENLYKLAAPATDGATARKVVERLRKSARGADNPDSGVSDNHIAPAPPKLPTLDEAFEAAKKGIRFE